MENTTTQINGNSVTVTEVYSDTYHHLVNTTEIEFDDIENPTNIISINTEEIDAYIYGGGSGGKTRTAKANNIPLLKVYDNGTKRFFIDGDISQHLTNLTYIETNNNNATIKELLNYQSAGSIEIMVYYEQ